MYMGREERAPVSRYMSCSNYGMTSKAKPAARPSTAPHLARGTTNRSTKHTSAKSIPARVTFCEHTRAAPFLGSWLSFLRAVVWKTPANRKQEFQESLSRGGTWDYKNGEHGWELSVIT